MGKINGCLKCLFVFFNVLFAIVGCIMIYGAVKASALNSQMSAVGGPSTAWSWVLAIGVLGISCLGIFAGCSEKELALKIFAGFMGVGMIIMLIFGIIVIVTRNKVKSSLEDASSELAKQFMEEEDMRSLLDGLQQNAQCCGVSDISDWGNDIPMSCACSPGQPSLFGGSTTCTSKPAGATGPDRIFEQSCGENLFLVFDFLFKIVIGILFFFAVTALLGLLITLLMLHQIRRHDGTGGASIAMKGY